MQVKADIQHQHMSNPHIMNFKIHQQEVVMDLSNPQSKKHKDHFAVSESGALDLSAPKYKNGEKGQIQISNVKNRKMSSHEDDSDCEEGRLVIDDVVESQGMKIESGVQSSESPDQCTQIINEKHNDQFRQSSDFSKESNFLDEDSARKLLYQQFLKSQEDAAKKQLDSKDDEKTSIANINRVSPLHHGMTVFPNMNGNMNFPMQLNLAQTLMVMNMNGMNTNGMVPFLNPVASHNQEQSMSQDSLNAKVSLNQNESLKSSSVGPVKRATSGRRARLATGNQNGQKSVVEIYECKICNRKFSQVGNFHNHMKTHDLAEKICVCGICKMEFQDSYELQRHMRTTHTGDMPYKCEQCDREFSQYNNLRRHLRVHNGNMYKCQICGRTFNESFYLEMHLSSHTGERTYKCGICSFTCKDNTDLQMHIKSHRADELHTCDVCNKSFSKACVLRQHKKMHTGIRPFKCDVCGKAFIHRHHLTIHSRMHSTDRPYTCKICNKEFAQTSHLYKHIRQHNDENGSGVQVKALLEELQKSQEKLELAKNSKPVSSVCGKEVKKEFSNGFTPSNGHMTNGLKSELQFPTSVSEKEIYLNKTQSELSISLSEGSNLLHMNHTVEKRKEMLDRNTYMNGEETMQSNIKQVGEYPVQQMSENSVKVISNSHADSSSFAYSHSGEIASQCPDSMVLEAMDSEVNSKRTTDSEFLEKINSPDQSCSSPELPSSTVPDVKNFPKDSELSPVSDSEIGTKHDSENLSHGELYNIVRESKEEKISNHQVLADKIFNRTQGEPVEEEVTKENEKVVSYPYKQTKENADIVGGLVARLLQEKQNGQTQKATEKKRRSTPVKRKQKHISDMSDSSFKPIVPSAITPEDHQLYLMQLQRVQAIQMAMMNPMVNQDMFLYHNNGTSLPVSPSMQQTKRFDFDQFSHLRASPSYFEKMIYNHDQNKNINKSSFPGSPVEKIPDGVLDRSREQNIAGNGNRFFNPDFGIYKTNGNSPGRFSSPSLSEEFSDEAIDMSSKRSQTGSTSSQFSEDTAESE